MVTRVNSQLTPTNRELISAQHTLIQSITDALYHDLKPLLSRLSKLESKAVVAPMEKSLAQLESNLGPRAPGAVTGASCLQVDAGIPNLLSVDDAINQMADIAFITQAQHAKLTKRVTTLLLALMNYKWQVDGQLGTGFYGDPQLAQGRNPLQQRDKGLPVASAYAEVAVRSVAGQASGSNCLR